MTTEWGTRQRRVVGRYIRIIAGTTFLLAAGSAFAAEPLPTPADAPLDQPIIRPVLQAPSGTPPIAQAGGSAGAMYSSSSLAVPSGTAAGRTPTNFNVSNSGSANYTIPIWAPPGVGAVQLQLALSYSSRSPDGVIGMGWSLTGLSSISRCNKSMAQDGAPASITLTLADRFCLDGQQLKLTSSPGTYGQSGSTYATEIDSFSKIAASGAIGNGPASFTVTTKNGLIYDYGLTSDAQIMAGSSGTIRTWALSQVRDRVGNKITFSYTNDTTNGSYRVASISYPTTAAGQGPFYQVLFAYSARPTTDIPSAYVDGAPTRELNQLNTITIQTYPAGTVIKTYNLLYAQGAATNRLHLTSVQECSASNCFPKTTISYQDGQAGWNTTAQSTGHTTPTTTGVLTVDLNGDGITDIVYPATSTGTNWYVMYGTATGAFQAPVSLGISVTPGQLIVAGSLSGQSASDLLYVSNGYWWRLYWNGTGVSTQNTNFPLNTVVGSSTGATFADVNGDGLPDVIFAVNLSPDADVYVAINTTPPGGAVSFGAPTSWFFQGGDSQNTWTITNGIHRGNSSVTVADFNGDGRADSIIYLKKVYNSCPPPAPIGASVESLQVAPACGQTITYYWAKLVSTGTGFASSGYNLSYVPALPIVPIDWNGDGCSDIAVPGMGNGGYWTIYLSACDSSGAVQLGTGITTSVPYNWSALGIDWDGDGRQDLLVATNSGHWQVARSTGEGVAASLIDTGITPGSNAWIVGDFDGDGLNDLAWIDAGSSNTIKVNLRAQPSIFPDLATKFTDGFGMYQSPSYAPLSQNNYSKYSNAVVPEVDYQGPLYAVNQFTASDGTGSTYQQQFWYYGARLQVQGRGFEGFYAQRVFDSRNSLYTYDYVQQSFPYTGMFYQRIVSNGTHYLTEWAGNVNNQPITGNGGYDTRWFPFIANATTTQWEVGGTKDGNQISQSTTTYTYGDGYGNQTQVVTSTTDQDTASPASPFNGQTWTTTVNNTFSNTASTNCFGVPTVTTVQNVVPGQTTQTRTYNYSVDTSLCRVTQQDIEPATASLHVNTALGFDSCGNVSSAAVTGHNPDGSAMPTRTTSFNYSVTSPARCQLPEQVTNALGQSTAIVYNYNFGVPSSTTDPNSLTTSWLQDDFGRLTRETRPDGTYTTRGYSSCLNSACGVADLALDAYDSVYGSDSSYVTGRNLYSDGFDRTRYDEAYRVLGTWTYEAIIYYDSLGRPVTQYQPYSSSSNGYRTWSYDSLNRVTTIRLYQPSGTLDRTTTAGYAGRTITITDPLGRQTQNVSDVRSRLRRVIDPSPGGTAYYDFDAFGNLNRIQDAIGAVSSGTYNLRGLRTQWADADRGTWNFSGDSLNELVSWTDAKTQPFSAIYDSIGRMTSRTESEGTSTWTWGTSVSSHNIGRLQSVSGYGYSDSLSYDAVGRLQTRLITTDQAYQFDYTYNTIGALNTLVYPTSPIPSGQTGSRFTIQYGYSYGEPYTISDITSGTATTLWSLTAANDYDLPAGETLYSSPNATTVASGYKSWTGELTSIQTGVSPSSTNRQNLAYQWDTVGNLTQRQDLNQSLTESFTPDALNRLQSSTLNGITNLTVGYDASGNITSKSDVGTYTYPAPTSPQPHGVTIAGSFSFAYDANGNVATRNGLGQTWASFNLPTALQATVSGSTYVSQFWYGPEHQRWKQYSTYSNGTETTLYVGGVLEKMTPSTTGVTYWRHYVNTPSGLTILVSRNSNGSYAKDFVLSDHLGSSDALLANDGSRPLQESFAPFGARRGSSWSGVPSSSDWTNIAAVTRRGFTFHEHLDNIGLIHANGRTYDPVVGRFMSVDPILGDLLDSQSINPFAYVGNRPLTSVDPSGFDANGGGGGGGTVVYTNDRNSPFAKALYKIAGWWGDVFNALGITRHAPPPPPPTVLPGISAQTSAAPCGGGNFLGECGNGAPFPGATTGINPLGLSPNAGSATPDQPEQHPVVATAADVNVAPVVRLPGIAWLLRVLGVLGASPAGPITASGIILCGDTAHACSENQKPSKGSDSPPPSPQEGNTGPDNGGPSSNSTPPPPAQGRKPLLGRNPTSAGSRTNTGLPGTRATGKSIFRNQTRGQSPIDQNPMDSGGVRRTAPDGSQIRMNPDGTTRLDLPDRGPSPNGETVHIPPKN